MKFCKSLEEIPWKLSKHRRLQRNIQNTNHNFKNLPQGFIKSNDVGWWGVLKLRVIYSKILSAFVTRDGLRGGYNDSYDLLWEMIRSLKPNGYENYQI